MSGHSSKETALFGSRRRRHSRRHGRCNRHRHVLFIGHHNQVDKSAICVFLNVHPRRTNGVAATPPLLPLLLLRTPVFENVLLIACTYRQLLREIRRPIDEVVGYYREATILYSYDGSYAKFVDL